MREYNLQRRVLSQAWVARPASLRLQMLRGGLSCGGKEGRGVLASPAVRSAALPPSPQRRAGEAHGCGWAAGLGRALLLTPTHFLFPVSVPGPSASLKPLTQRHQQGSTKFLPTDSLLGASPPPAQPPTRDTSHPQKGQTLFSLSR